jgi:Protein of unknown function (DUF4199)
MEEQSKQEVTTRSVGIRYGLFMGAFSIVFFLALNFAGTDMSSGISRWGSAPFLIAIMYLAHRNFIENGDSFMTYGQGMSIAAWIGVVSSVLYSFFFYVFIKFIDGSFIEKILTTSREKMLEKGVPDEQIDQAMGFTSAFMTPGVMTFFGLIGAFISAVVCGLIVSAFTQKSNPQPV